MLDWLKRLGAPKNGPDFRRVDTREKAEDLVRKGELTRLLLLPPEFGGENHPGNIVYVPAFAAEIKAGIDANTIMPLVNRGQIRHYAATPEYEGKSFVPSLIRISASDPGTFEGTVAIWGIGLQNNSLESAKLPDHKVPEFSLPSNLTPGISPEDFVRAYIDDYERWNAYAMQVSGDDFANHIPEVEAAYATLCRKYCLPDQVFQPVSFGSKSSHDNIHEVITEVTASENSYTVLTRHSKVIANTTLNSDFEYLLKRVNDRWYLTSLAYVDQDGKWEGL